MTTARAWAAAPNRVGPRPESIGGPARRHSTSDRGASPAPIRFPPDNFKLSSLLEGEGTLCVPVAYPVFFLLAADQIMSSDTLSLSGKVAIITGSGKENGIGAGIAHVLAQNGGSVAINYVSDSTAPRAAKVVEKIKRNGGKAVVVQADISTPDGATKLVNETLKAFQTHKVDILGTIKLQTIMESVYLY